MAVLGPLDEGHSLPTVEDGGVAEHGRVNVASLPILVETVPRHSVLFHGGRVGAKRQHLALEIGLGVQVILSAQANSLGG